MLKRIWSDPVGATVIGGLLTAAALSVVSIFSPDGYIASAYSGLLRWWRSTALLKVWQVAAWTVAIAIPFATVCCLILWRRYVRPRDRRIAELTSELMLKGNQTVSMQSQPPALDSDDLAVLKLFGAWEGEISLLDIRMRVKITMQRAQLACDRLYKHHYVLACGISPSNHTPRYGLTELGREECHKRGWL